MSGTPGATRRLALTAALVAAVSAVAAPAAAKPSTTESGRRTLTGTIGGADFRVELPERWNGTLVLYSHGYLPEGFPSFGIGLTNRPPDRSETEAWLLDHGYAMAASQFADGGVGYAVERGLRDQIALLDWFEAHVGPPRRTIATGQSMGAGIAVQLAERHPRRFAGVATMCGAYDTRATFDTGLDVLFAVRTLLAPDRDIDLVRPDDPAGSAQALAEAIQQALTTRQGRARLALAAALNNVTGWYSAHETRPTDPVELTGNQAEWLQYAYGLGFGPPGRLDLERRAGGNPSTNVGVDYRRQLLRSAQTRQVEQAYRAAGLDLRADLGRLAAAPRIAADPAAVDYLHRVGVPEGRTPVPVVTMHTVGDGGAPPHQERWYADQVRRAGDPGRLRQLWVDRGGHCSFSAAEEIVLLRTLVARLDSGHWPETGPRALHEAARALGDPYQLVLDLGRTFADAPMPPAFTRFTPPLPLRPSR
ncbi:alpha/beta fold hydrolase [Micromonospora narathiwatensis]|uniref:Alpha/beta hydrolase fold n=1 Tax=Micromonospora narathiwatensis TaxID=299146 RepID=A0A1A8ZPY2_9ACTN|nr:alpha/beta fold hydrolase [Micromonospora narathiwatensis]SBT45887.1 alpha/beta hydrolase fold [Micromonospora narathiwatensis]